MSFDMAAPAVPPMRAYVVDGHAETTRLCVRVLEECGYRAMDADTGVAAIAAVRDSMPDLILVGPQLRDVPGGQFVEWLGTLTDAGPTRLVLLDPDLAHTAAPANVLSTVVVPKPFSARALRRVVRALSKIAVAGKSSTSQCTGAPA